MASDRAETGKRNDTATTRSRSQPPRNNSPCAPRYDAPVSDDSTSRARSARPLDVLLVEDDPPLANALLVNLRSEGWSVRWAASGADAMSACRDRAPDVVVLDLMLPDASGLDVCVDIRREIPKTPGVLMLTARGTEADVVLGLDHGADDYVVKPCRPRELSARIRAVARRVRPERSDPLEGFTRGPLRFDPLRRRVWVNEHELSLTPTEHELLARIARHDDRVHARMELLEAVFDSTHAGYARNVDCHVTRLRRKLEAAGMKPAPIRTIHGKGYRFEVA
jgi:DNA-binding response OmpR family regulator